MILSVEDPEVQDVTLPVPWVRFLARLSKLQKGKRYTITLDIDPRLGPSWTVMEMGKIERGSRLNGNGGGP